MPPPVRPGGRSDAAKPPAGIGVVRFRAPVVEVGYRQAPPRGDFLKLTVADKSPRERFRAGLVLAGTVAATVGAILGAPAGYLFTLVGVPVSFAVAITHFGRRTFHVEEGRLTIESSGLMSPAPTTIALAEVVKVRVSTGQVAPRTKEKASAVVAEMSDGRKVTILSPAPSQEHARYLAATLQSEADFAKGPPAW